MEAEAIFARQNVGNLFGALACGTDIVVAEAALGLGIPFHAVLPFPVARFAELSVDIGDAKGAEGSWRRRFDDILSRAATLTIVDEEMPLERDLDGHFYYGFRFMAGQALMRAAILQTECRLIAVTDGSQAVNLAGTSRAVADWLEAGRPLDAIEIPLRPEDPVGSPTWRFLVPACRIPLECRRLSGRSIACKASPEVEIFAALPDGTSCGGAGVAHRRRGDRNRRPGARRRAPPRRGLRRTRMPQSASSATSGRCSEPTTHRTRGLLHG